MRSQRPLWALALLLPLALAPGLLARGQFWDFLGYTQVDSGQDHSKIQIVRRDRPFRTIQVRVRGEAIFFDRLIVHFGNGTSQQFVVSGRISPEGKEYVIELPGERRALESVELWYYKEAWGHTPRVSLYGIRLPDLDGQSAASDN